MVFLTTIVQNLTMEIMNNMSMKTYYSELRNEELYKAIIRMK